MPNRPAHQLIERMKVVLQQRVTAGTECVSEDRCSSSTFTHVFHASMISASDSQTSAPNAIDSAQVDANGQPRFRIPAQPNHPAWASAQAQEIEGGWAAAIRVFLDQQLTHGDVVLDLDPGFGFVALGAATAPGGSPTVFAYLDDNALIPLQDAAADAGAWIEGLGQASQSSGSSTEVLDVAAIEALLDSRLEPDGRVFVHVAPERVIDVCRDLAALCLGGSVLALCVSDVITPQQWPSLNAALAAAGLAGCALVERDDDVMLLPLSSVPDSGLIAVPASLFGDLDVPAKATAAATSEADATSSETTAADAAAPSGTVARRAVQPGYLVERDGFFFLAPHVRTGYGVVGAELLRVLLARHIPLAFVPNGRVDTSLTTNEYLAASIERQQHLAADVPSVRLAQAFDLSEHAGQGPRVGFPIFETDAFSAHEVEQMQALDALLVCSEWAVGVCRANGLTSVPIHIVPLGVDRAVFHPEVAAREQSSATTFVQVGKLEPRKGQFELLCAFEAAFSPDDNVRLVLACHNPFISTAMFDASLAPFLSSPMASRITVIRNELPSRHDVASLMASADCGVCVSRAEGWNLEALEFLSLGKQLIATNATGHTAFLNAQNARLISMDAMEPAMGGQIHGRWPAWGVSQHEQLVAQLRAVHANRQEGKLDVNTAGVATASSLTWEHSAQALLNAIGKLS